jgi:ferredoxin
MKKAGKKKAARKTAAKKPVRRKTAPKKASDKRVSARRAAKPAGTADVPKLAPGVPNIDYSLCQGCAGCAEAFPHLFEMRGERAWVIDPEGFDPVRDAGVMTICPYYAISIEKV